MNQFALAAAREHAIDEMLEMFEQCRNRKLSGPDDMAWLRACQQVHQACLAEQLAFAQSEAFRELLRDMMHVLNLVQICNSVNAEDKSLLNHAAELLTKHLKREGQA